MHTVADVMTRHPYCCVPDTPLTEAARAMRDGNFGAVLVVDSPDSLRLEGIITDRDVVVRAIAEGIDPAGGCVRQFMTHSVHALPSTASIKECRALMESVRVRRVPIVDEAGAVVGVVSLTDFAREARRAEIGATLNQIAEPDTRQLYSEVMEGADRAGAVTPVEHPEPRLPIRQP